MTVRFAILNLEFTNSGVIPGHPHKTQQPHGVFRAQEQPGRITLSHVPALELSHLSVRLNHDSQFEGIFILFVVSFTMDTGRPVWRLHGGN